MINITFHPENLELKVSGHAEHDEKGKDIVCAAVSALFYTLGESLVESQPMLKDWPVFSDEEGNGHIQCTPKEEYEGNIARTYWTILVGLQMIAEQYPDNVSLKVEC